MEENNILLYILVVFFTYVYAMTKKLDNFDEGTIGSILAFVGYGLFFLLIGSIMVPISSTLDEIHALTYEGPFSIFEWEPSDTFLFGWASDSRNEGMIAIIFLLLSFVCPVFLLIQRIGMLITGRREIIVTDKYDENDLIVFLEKCGIKVETTEGFLGHTVSKREAYKLRAYGIYIRTLASDLGYKYEEKQK